MVDDVGEVGSPPDTAPTAFPSVFSANAAPSAARQALPSAGVGTCILKAASAPSVMNDLKQAGASA